MANAQIQLQQVTSVDNDASPKIMSGDPVEVGAYDEAVALVNRSVASAVPGAVLTLQTSTTKTGNYVDLAPAIDMNQAGLVSRRYPHIMGWIRWRAWVPDPTGGNPSITFSIHLMLKGG